MQAHPPADQAQLRSLCLTARQTFEFVLEASLGTKDTQDTCFYAAGLLVELVRKFTRAEAIMRGGGPEEGAGYRDTSGRLHGHYWVETLDPEYGAWVLDITADQFGGPQVFVAPLHLAAEIYLPGDQGQIDRHVQADWEQMLNERLPE